ncbi:MAG TPA: ABC transporter ATP-binding protein [Acidimicrobiales bacterium]
MAEPATAESPTLDIATGTGIDVRKVAKRFGPTVALAGVDLTVEPGTVTVLLGPSGCGKTTLLRSIAGLEVPDAGEIRLGARLVTGQGVFVVPERRRVGMVFQDWALFPHLTVFRNVAYGVPKGADRVVRVQDALTMVGLTTQADRLPATLSGGQQQRVALARALAPRPEVLLLDEPFSNLDTALRVAVRSEVHALLAELGVTAVFVTHDQEEAFILGDRVVVIRAGVVEQTGTPAELYDAPANRWVADFVGDANFVPGEATAGTAATPLGRVPLVGDVSGPVDALVRPEALHLTDGGDGTVELVEYFGHDTMYRVQFAGLSLAVRSTGPPRHQRGDTVGIRYVGDPAPSYPSSTAEPASTG